MNTKKIIALLLTVLILLLGIVLILTLLLRVTDNQPVNSSQGNQSTTEDNTLFFAGADPVTLDPHLAGDATSAKYIVELFSGLVTITPEMEIVLDLAEALEVSEDGLQYNFKLRDDIYFHSGRKVTVEDVKWSFERAGSRQLNSNTSLSYLKDIVGFSEKRFGIAEEISGIKILNKNTIQITIDSPKAYFLAKLSYPTSFVLDKEQIALNPRNWTRKPNGTGPYKLADWQLSEKIILEANASYHLGPPKIKNVVYALSGGSVLTRFENGEVDLAGIGTPDIDRIRDASNPLNSLYYQSSYFQTSYIGLNTMAAPFDDVNVRRAFASSIDISKVTELTYKKMYKQATGILPPGMYGYESTKKTFNYDPELAREFLKKSKYGTADNLPPIVFSDIGAGAEGSVDTQAYIEQWKLNLGVNITLRQTDFASFLQDLDEGKMQMYAIGWIMDYPDPENILDLKFHSESTENNENYSNQEVDKLLELARSENDIEKRKNYYQQAEKLILDEVPWIPTYFPSSHYVVNKKIKKWVEPPMTVPRLRFIEIIE